MLHRTCVSLLAGALGIAGTPALLAQDFPQRPVRWVVPFAPGGPTDVLARLVGARLAEGWGQQVVIDNRAGANGRVGAELAARAAADGHTLLMVTAGFAINATLYPKMPYDSLKDFTALAPLASGPGMLVVHPQVPAQSVKELIGYARGQRGGLSYGSSGSGSPSHLAVELLRTLARVEMTHVPYKGMGPAMSDLIAGQLQLGIPTILAAVPHVKTGRVRALAVTSAQRTAAAPDLPTIAEAGIAGYEATNWIGVMLPANARAALVARLAADIDRVLRVGEVRERLLALGMDPMQMAPAAFQSHVGAEIAKWAGVIRAAGVRGE